MSNKITFIGGVHGAGKGTICKKLSTKYSIPHYSASELLKWEEISNPDNKRVKDFSSTQERLLKGIKNKIKKDELTILDGHFCLLNSLGQPERIPVETFIQINPILIAVVSEDISTIRERLEARDKRQYNYEILARMQNMELQYAQEIAGQLTVPFFKISSNNYEDLIFFLGRLR